MILEFLGQIFSFYSADSDADATVTCSGVVWFCSLVSRWTDVDLLSEFVIFIIAPSHKVGGTNTFNLGGTWYLMSWYRYLKLSPPSWERSLNFQRALNVIKLLIRSSPCQFRLNLFPISDGIIAIFQSYGVKSVQHEISRRQILLQDRRKLVSRMRFPRAFFISLPISRDKTAINCINKRDWLSYLSFLLSYWHRVLPKITKLDFVIKKG